MAEESDRVLLRTGPSRLLILHYYLLFFLLIAAAVALALRFIPYVVLDRDIHLLGAGALAGFAFIILLFAELHRASHRYVVGETTLAVKEGLFRRKIQYIPYRQIERVELDQGILARIFNIGEVLIDTGEDSVTMRAVKGPERVRKIVMERLAGLVPQGTAPPLQPRPR